VKSVESNLDYNLAQHNQLVDKQLFQDTNLASEIKLLRSRMYDNEKYMQNTIQKMLDLEKMILKNEAALK
jgi:hypothetical protein